MKQGKCDGATDQHTSCDTYTDQKPIADVVKHITCYTVWLVTLMGDIFMFFTKLYLAST